MKNDGNRRYARELGALMRRKRISAGLSQVGFADAMGVSQATVSDWERGASIPSPVYLSGALRRLNITDSEYLRVLDRAAA